MKKLVLIVLLGSGSLSSYSQILGNLLSIAPDSAVEGQTLMTTITAQPGTFMISSPPCSYLDVYLQQGNYTIISNTINILWQDQLEAEFSIPAGAPSGYYDVYQGSGHYDWWTGNCLNYGYWVLINGFRVVGTTAVADAVAVENSASVYPNPLSGNSILSFSNAERKKYKLTVMDSFGREIRNEVIDVAEVMLYRKDFVAGIYFYRLEGMENKLLYNGRFVVME